MSDLPARAGEFFAGHWLGVGDVRDLLDRRLRRLNLTFTSTWSAHEAAFLFEEVTAKLDGSMVLHRSWHVQTDGEGAYVGMESLQGGRLVAEDRRWGFTLAFEDRRSCADLT